VTTRGDLDDRHAPFARGEDDRSRREFLKAAGRAAARLGIASACTIPWARLAAAAPVDAQLAELLRTAPRARFWTSAALAGADCAACHGDDRSIAGRRSAHDRKLVRCLLCAHGCGIAEGERGRCRARYNAGGELRSLVYGRPVSIHVDPIEKKPFYHFLPGSAALSFGTAGCPLRCAFCQNWRLSQARPEELAAPYVPPDRMAAEAASGRAPVVAFTYNEPTVQAEYLLDVARSARKLGIRSAIVSCGFMNEAPLREMCEALDAVKIDLKGFSPDFYREVSGAELAPVLRSIRQAARSGVHLEIVNLVVPTLNDSDRMLRSLADWVAGEVGPDVPLHFTRFHPDYRLQNLPPTPVSVLEKARETAMGRGIRYVYVGNVPGHPGNHTYCPACGKAVVRRSGFLVSGLDMVNGRCRFCRAAIAGVWS
jgi:pyruvate formate lyase activating enzyme